MATDDSAEADSAFDAKADGWQHGEAAAAYDALHADPARAIRVEEVRTRLEAKWAARS